MDDPEYAELARHGWVDCTENSHERKEDDPPCWHHPYFDMGNEPFITKDALDETEAFGARLAACAAGLVPDENGFPDRYSQHFPWEERIKRARDYREKTGWKGSRLPIRKWLNKGPR